MFVQSSEAKTVGICERNQKKSTQLSKDEVNKVCEIYRTFLV